MKNQYVIVGDTENHEGCLVFVCGCDKNQAEKILEKMTNNPDNNDKLICKGHKNLRIKTIEPKACWWNDPVLCN